MWTPTKCTVNTESRVFPSMYHKGLIRVRTKGNYVVLYLVCLLSFLFLSNFGVAQTTSETNMHEDGARFDQEGNLYRPLNDAGVDYYKVEKGKSPGSGKRYVLQNDDTFKVNSQSTTVREGSIEHSTAIAHGSGFRLQSVEDKLKLASDRQHAKRLNDGKHMYTVYVAR